MSSTIQPEQDGKTKNMTTQSLSMRNSINRPPWRRGLLLISLILAFAWLAFLPTARAVTPAPDGGYENEITAEGEDALFSLTTGIDSTAVGYHALHDNKT